MEPGTQHLTFVYLAYATASVGLTVWLARTLSRNGEVFLEDVFADKPRMVKAVNQLLVVGFYLVNLGYALITLKAGSHQLGEVEAIETLATKLGSLLLALAVMHFGNLYVFHRIRRRTQIRLALPPVQAQLQRFPQQG
ncbi:MAG: hypothetical protein ACOY0T_06805 [Myxococcota bacterium]